MLLKGFESHLAETLNKTTQGFLVGNPWTDAGIDNTGVVEYWWSHAIISDSARSGILKNCDLSHVGPLSTEADLMVSADLNVASRAKMCDGAIAEAFANMGNINIYDIYADMCLPKSVRTPAAAMGTQMQGSAPSFALAFAFAKLKDISGVSPQFFMIPFLALDLILLYIFRV